jgi:L-threonylcarbamoyladenylate synthase
MPLQLPVVGTAPRVPGSVAQHYAPQTPLTLVPAGALEAAVKRAEARGELVVTLARAPGADAVSYGRALYAELRRLDKQGASRILVESVPESADWDAVRDRLTRAAATFR